MPGWDEILELVNYEKTQSQPDIVRRRFLRELAEYRDRNLIIYYSGWLKKGNLPPNIDINDDDMEGFMNAVKGLDCSKGLDLFLHTPGGDPHAAEAIVKYLKSKFNRDIVVFVPHLAMSAGTMIACAAKEIVLGKQSSLGPIDPQFAGIPAHNIKKEFEEAEKDLRSNPQNVNFWAIRLQLYPAAFMYTAIDAIESSQTMLREWLLDNMFLHEAEKNAGDTIEIINNIVSHLNDHSSTMSHSKHLDAEFCKSLGLKIRMMEDDQVLQDKVLSVHHSAMITISGTAATKIIENHLGKAYMNVSMPN